MDRGTPFYARPSFAIGRNGDRSARIRRVIATASAQGDQQTVELAQRRLHHIEAMHPQLPAFALRRTCQDD